MILRSEIAQRVFGATLLMDTRKIVAALAAVGGRIVEGGVSFAGGIAGVDHVAFADGRPSGGSSMGRIGDELGRAYDADGRRPFDVVGNVAVIAVEGTLVHKGAHVGMLSGRTSYQGLQTQAVRAMRDPDIRGAVLEVDSFGGEAAGAWETAEAFHALSMAKPTLAIPTNHALSAGYLLAASARTVVMPPDGAVGSIGAVKIHIDESRALEQEGVKVTLVSAGKQKTAGNPFERLPDDLKDRWQGEVETSRQRFSAAVGRFRGKRFTASQALATEADYFLGPQALALGLVDAVGDPVQAFEAFVRAVNQRVP